MEKFIEKANTLIEAIPYIRNFYGKTFVIKYGGNAMIDEDLKENFALDIILLKFIGINPVIVHGGGPQIGSFLKKIGKDTKFFEGYRITDDETMDVVEMVLGGIINKSIVALINKHGGKAIGLTGKDGNFIKATKMVMKKKKPDKNNTELIDLGRVGEIEEIDPTVIDAIDKSFIPVIAPIGVDCHGSSLNINADLVAGAIAWALKAEKLVLLTDVKGIMDRKNKLIRTLTEKQVKKLIKDGVIKGGMLPKLRCCLEALDQGVSKVHMVDGRVKHALLLEIFTNKGVGTEIVK
ncbi:MAG: acetylglutamate kinase [Candidatus Schekmanbacteria bacterium RIFCSPHIGHO2_02_FULL_38_11]|uniref:Acetylglutamate kinase n=1 Tax=Candidatus Schekmanbacteria bacterium RIFCSPLOWO2_12_FULL_38_15 TaxID=1817883 RepID=A0A1F7SN80_9BACT|nr:MAG: acetylglutamate kinase [Candidatus Schekmanbacteria bacterium GWA2_38_9]OGL50134.1 MAG: acetylglutamate kinase [Candidatus Schekmanbacteria bacterium RIFCSPLOWO2_02_FULL_38_14]OGL54315.1 MAG: acetylglutamate kinase [Candidatus Schekmanbacteria bacterium RIFCSPHIGHO2_02_FULL_38_11]OGL55240.1 MAG: acetylglutamate kinase [Candidatus Schekmanbacteria bacterium RIFCSPLOWO2_12_FULL_38_15]